MRFFLHIQNAVSHPDEHGSDFATDRLALGQAALTAGEILRDEIASDRSDASVRVLVEDEEGRRVGTVEASLLQSDGNIG